MIDPSGPELDGNGQYDPEHRAPEGRNGEPSPTPEHLPIDGGFPWPPPAGRSPLEALVETWRISVFQPTRFFRDLPVPGPIGPAVLYFLIVGVLAVGVGTFWQIVMTSVFGMAGLRSSTAPSPMGDWVPVINFLLSPIYLLVGLGISFLITHAVLAIIGGARRGPGTTIRVLAFSYGPALFAVFPFIGAFAGGIWTIVLAVIGIREAHRTDLWRAVVAVLFPILALLVLAFLIALFVGVMATIIAI